MKTITVLLIASLVMLTAIGCAPRIVTFRPTVTETILESRSGEATFSCWPIQCFHTHGLNCLADSIPDDMFAVGFSYLYNDGTPPCNCWYYVDCAFRGGVRFDVGWLRDKRIVDARLTYNDTSCLKRVFVAAENWGVWDARRHLDITGRIRILESGGVEVPVVDFVRAWVEGARPNHGFLLAGPDETFPNWSWDHRLREFGTGVITERGTRQCKSITGPAILVVYYQDE